MVENFVDNYRDGTLTPQQELSTFPHLNPFVSHRVIHTFQHR